MLSHAICWWCWPGPSKTNYDQVMSMNLSTIEGWKPLMLVGRTCHQEKRTLIGFNSFIQKWQTMNQDFINPSTSHHVVFL